MNDPMLIILNGLTYGGLLFMGASGLTLILGLMGVVNMAHGTYYLFGAMIGYMAIEAGASWYFAIIIAGIAIALLSYLVRKVLFQYVVGQGMRVTLLTIGISMIIADVVLWLTAGRPELILVPEIIGKSYNLGFVNYSGTRLFIMAIAIVQGIFLWALMYKTRMGQYIRAGADKREMAEALGVNINAVFTFIFIVSGLLVGMSGVLGASYSVFTVGATDSQVLSYSLVIIVLGGMGSLKGAAVGAILVGLIDSISKTFVPNLTPTIVFGLVILLLAFRPQGLFGREA